MNILQFKILLPNINVISLIKEEMQKNIVCVATAFWMLLCLPEIASAEQVKIEVNAPSEVSVDIFLDGSRLKKIASEANLCSVEVDPGKHVIELRRVGYYPERIEFTLKKGEPQTLKFTLREMSDIFSEEEKLETNTVVSTKTGTDEIDKWNIAWVPIPGGTFEMGCSKEDSSCEGDETPCHTVKIKTFKLMKYEVTQSQYKAIIRNNRSYFSRCGGECPVEMVTWNKAKEFCGQIGGRLPNEAEWEYAGRAGTTTKYYCGDDESCLGGIAWYKENSGSTTHPVGQKKQNEQGIFDMLGNVWEWVEDCYSSDYSSGKDCTMRVVRGGSYFNEPWYLRVSYRYRFGIGYKTGNVGFRCARG